MRRFVPFGWRYAPRPDDDDDELPEGGHRHQSGRTPWEKHSAIAAIVSACMAVGVFIVAVYVPFFSELPGYLKKISELSAQTTAAQTAALKSQTAALGSQKQVNDAFARALNAETDISRAMLDSSAAEQRAGEMSRKAEALASNVSGLRAESAALTARNAKAQSDLKGAEATTKRLIDLTVGFMHANSYKQFIDQTGNRSFILIPTNQTVLHQADAETVFFSIMDRKLTDISDPDIAAGRAVIIGNYVVLGFVKSVGLPSAGGMHMQVKVLDQSDPRFAKFVSLLRSKPAMNILTLTTMHEFGELPDIPHPQVIDVLRAQFAGRRQFAIGFYPGKTSDDTYEDGLIRDFWISGVSDQISRMSNSMMSIKNQLNAVESGKFDMDKGLTISIGKPQWDDALKRISDAFGPTAMKYMQQRLSQLDDLWVQQLTAGDIEFVTGEPFTLDTQKHASQVFDRWNWSDSDQSLSAKLFDMFQQADRVNFVLSCAGAAYLDTNQLSAGPEVSTTLNGCRMSGFAAVQGGRTMVFVEFVGPTGADMPMPCDQIKGAVSSPSGYKYEFSPMSLDPNSDRSSCTSVLLVPAGEPITIAATAPGLVGQPAMTAPIGESRARPPQIGWSNPTTFRTTDHAPGLKRRIVEMRPSTNTGQ